ncbi:flagellin-like protein [Methanomicrobium sp. W14]|uniref:type IV pilin N-terminal domain-containing protein n=1 Tax=Methanomicrobium sp. W14 TaxID=2817839 RepID=UPI001FDA5D03|nr:type IV pilin N-terminal domain-containing protein [Methanomicrobium sp. W14]MBP2133475.1 flagellin-like protein [Methanomicrobium sp. W14]
MKNDEAVSPVIGVMLMIVVTIVIAAAVSAFAGNMDLDQKTGPNVNLQSELVMTSAEPVTVTYTYYCPDDLSAGEDPLDESSSKKYTISPNGGQHGILFTNIGGDAIDLKDLQMDVSSNNFNVLVDYTVTRDQASTNSLPDGKVGDDYDTSGDIIYSIDISDSSYTLDDVKAMATNQSNRYFVKINPETTGDTIIRPGDQFKFYTDDGYQSWAMSARTGDGSWAGGRESFGMDKGSGNEWVLSHKPSGEILASGDIYFPDNN